MEGEHETFFAPVTHALHFYDADQGKLSIASCAQETTLNESKNENFILPAEATNPYSLVTVDDGGTARGITELNEVSDGRCTTPDVMKTDYRLPLFSADVEPTSLEADCSYDAISQYGVWNGSSLLCEAPDLRDDNQIEAVHATHDESTSLFAWYQQQFPTYYSSLRRGGVSGMQRVSAATALFQKSPAGAPTFPVTTDTPKVDQPIVSSIPGASERVDETPSRGAVPLTRQALDALERTTAPPSRRASELIAIKRQSELFVASSDGMARQSVTQRDEMRFDSGKGYLSVSGSDDGSSDGSVRSDVAMVSGHVNPELGYMLKSEKMRIDGLSEREIAWCTRHRSPESVALEHTRRRNLRNQARIQRRQQITNNAQETSDERRMRISRRQKEITRRLINLQKARDRGKLSNSRFESCKDQILASFLPFREAPVQQGSMDSELSISIRRKRRRESDDWTDEPHAIPPGHATPPPRASSPELANESTKWELTSTMPPKGLRSKDEQIRLMRLLDQRVPPKHRFFGTDTSPLDRLNRSKEESTFRSWEDEQSIPEVDRPAWMRDSARRRKLFKK